MISINFKKYFTEKECPVQNNSDLIKVIKDNLN